MLHLCRNRSTTYEIDGANVTGVFASDLKLAEVRAVAYHDGSVKVAILVDIHA
jgi:hypothetical protein